MKQNSASAQWTPQQIARWEKARFKGAKYYLLTRGLWLTPLSMLGWMIHGYFANQDFSWMFTSFRGFVISLAGCYLTGLIYAGGMWLSTEGRYRKAREEFKRAEAEDTVNTPWA